MPGRVRFVPFAPDVGLFEASVARRESRADFSELSLHLLDLSKWILAACGGFFREENIIVLEARSILYAVRYAKG